MLEHYKRWLKNMRGDNLLARGLDKQVYIYSVSTEAFYNDEEMIIHNRLSKLRILKSKISEKINKIKIEIKEAANQSEIDYLSERKSRLSIAARKINIKINKDKIKLKVLLSKNKDIRELREDALQINKKIGMFDSALTRTLGMKIDTVSTDILVVRVYYYQVLEGLISEGFMYKGEKYIYFSSSAGQIRTKK